MVEDADQQSLLTIIKSLLRKKNQLHKESDLSEEIQEIISEGEAKGLISHEESDMVHGVLDLKGTTAHAIMIPRTEISSASLDATLGDIIDLVRDCGHTRIPIYKSNIDDIVGILHAKDLLKLWGQDPASSIPVDILRQPYFVPDTHNVSELLRELKEKKSHLAIVADEYGGTAGIITIEDIIEEIVGEIMDEHDNERALLQPLDHRSATVDARLEIEKLGTFFGIEIPDGAFESVGGFIIHLLGRIPQVNEEISFKGLQMIIQKADERKIDKILVTLQTEDTPPAENKPEDT